MQRDYGRVIGGLMGVRTIGPVALDGERERIPVMDRKRAQPCRKPVEGEFTAFSDTPQGGKDP